MFEFILKYISIPHFGLLTDLSTVGDKVEISPKLLRDIQYTGQDTHFRIQRQNVSFNLLVFI